MTALVGSTVIWDFAGSPPRPGVSAYLVITGADLFARYPDGVLPPDRFFVPSSGVVLDGRKFRDRTIDRIATSALPGNLIQ